MSFELPQLPFAEDALSPWTSAETISFHYGKHHAGYVKKLNAAVEGTEWAEKDLIEVINGNRSNPGIFNSAAQHWNHSFFWNNLAPESSTPSEELGNKINESFGDFDTFKAKFGEKALKLFGSGWAWLVQNEDGSLSLEQYKDADTPAGTEKTPLLTLDVWEHAYYIDHRNNRAGFIEGFWNHVNWAFVDSQLKK